MDRLMVFEDSADIYSTHYMNKFIKFINCNDMIKEKLINNKQFFDFNKLYNLFRNTNKNNADLMFKKLRIARCYIFDFEETEEEIFYLHYYIFFIYNDLFNNSFKDTKLKYYISNLKRIIKIERSNNIVLKYLQNAIIYNNDRFCFKKYYYKHILRIYTKAIGKILIFYRNFIENRYKPDGRGYLEAKQSFENMLN